MSCITNGLFRSSKSVSLRADYRVPGLGDPVKGSRKARSYCLAILSD